MKAITTIMLALVSIFMRGMALAFLWEWFVVPLGAVQITILHALGLSLLIDITNHHLAKKKADEDMTVVGQFIVLIFTYAAVIGMGALVNWGMM